MSEQISIKSYNNTERATKYNTKQGFDPKRKNEMLNVTLFLLEDLIQQGASILELGAGSGLFTEKLINSDSINEIYVTDGAEVMLEIARKKLLTQSTNLVYDKLDFTQSLWSKRYKNIKFDAVTSSMAIHHAEDKKALFREVYNVLTSEGVFVFADHMAGETALIEKLIGSKRARLKLNSIGENLDTNNIDKFMREDKKKQDAEGNKCESISNYLQYLREVGFKDVDCLWRDYWLAVFVAKKSDHL
ncbi:class I SAM-dependent methyltransferase [Ornithinibacillus salinisoli]|uniref:Class I SAM-dependent methyltransferase n=1 Tax=Ornithinibacillus salinisoli TaxID=1848459 RepID=A0ABW4VU30_9BACI